MLFLYRNDDTMILLDCKVGTVDNSYSCFQNLENFSNSVIHFICSHFAEEKKVEINKFSVGTWIIGRFTFAVLDLKQIQIFHSLLRNHSLEMLQILLN